MDVVPTLQLNMEYTRRNVHDIFDPNSPFTPGAGTWGIHGIIKLPNRKKDYIFFVTFGQSVSGHDFEEQITKDGVLTWQSQPRQKLTDNTIKDFITHDYLKDNIYLFLRTKKMGITGGTAPFKYLGKIAYLEHDAQRESPVYFKWQLIDWEKLKEINKIETPKNTSSYIKNNNKLIKKETPPPKNLRQGVSTRKFKAKHIDFAKEAFKKKEIGDSGELLVLKYEKDSLIKMGRKDLAKKVVHTSASEGDGAGYDILSYTPEGDIKYIEVKTTTGGEYSAFDITANEIAFSEKYAANYNLVRIYNFNLAAKQGEFFEITGNLNSKLNLTPIGYKATL